MPGLLVKILKPPAKYRVGSFADSIDYARGAAHLDQDIVPERDLEGRMPVREDGHRGQLIAMQGVTSLNQAAIEMDAVANRSRAADSVLHMVLSYGEKVDPDLVAEDAKRLLSVLGANEHQFVCLGHDDVDGNYHAHLIMNRTHPTTFKAIHMAHSYARLECEATRINHARGWRIIPGNFNGKLIEQYAQKEREQIAKEARSQKEKDDELNRIKHQNREAISARKPIQVRSPRRAQHLGQKRLRVLSGRGVAYPEGQPPSVLPRDVSPDGDARRRLRVLEADAERVARKSDGLNPAVRSALTDRGEIPFAEKIRLVVTNNFELAESLQEFVNLNAAFGIETRLKVDVDKKTGKRIHKVSFGDPHQAGVGTSGTSVGVAGKQIVERWGDFDPEQIVAPVVAKAKIEAVNPSIKPMMARNKDLRDQHSAYRKNLLANNAIWKKEAFDHAWTQEQADRARDYSKIRKRKERRRMIVMIILKRGLIRSMILKRIDRAAEKQRAQAKAEAAMRWSLTKMDIQSDKIEKPLTYEQWLRAQPKSNAIDQELKIVTRGKYQPETIIHDPIFKESDKTKEIIREIEKKPDTAIIKDKLQEAARNVLSERFQNDQIRNPSAEPKDKLIAAAKEIAATKKDIEPKSEKSNDDLFDIDGAISDRMNDFKKKSRSKPKTFEEMIDRLNKSDYSEDDRKELETALLKAKEAADRTGVPINEIIDRGIKASQKKPEPTEKPKSAQKPGWKKSGWGRDDDRGR